MRAGGVGVVLAGHFFGLFGIFSQTRPASELNVNLTSASKLSPARRPRGTRMGDEVVSTAEHTWKGIHSAAALTRRPTRYVRAPPAAGDECPRGRRGIAGWRRRLLLRRR